MFCHLNDASWKNYENILNKKRLKDWEVKYSSLSNIVQSKSSACDNKGR